MSGRRYLLDVNVLIALAWPSHVHHAQAHAWFDRKGQRRWASCPLTQLAFVRISSNPAIIRDAVRPRDAVALLRRITALAGHEFWPDQVPLTGLVLFDNPALVGHRQVTDAYLLALCEARGGSLATFDRGIGELCSATGRGAELVEDI